MKLNKKTDCNGCMACLNACPHDALTISTDCEGFDHPVLNKILCVDCGFCEKACPVINPIKRNNEKQLVYACWTNNKVLRLKSSSGGLFTELASVILEKSGIIFGAALDDNLIVYHTFEDTENGLAKLRGSKYVQSIIGKSYKKVKEFLIKEKIVLFSGTPCQIAGLLAYLQKDYKNLYTLDIVCHGVPSPLIFEEYKSYIEKKINNKIYNIKFRDKKYSWIYYNISINEAVINKKSKSYIGSYYSDPYIRGFLRDYFLRPSCHECKYTNLDRMGDVTMADYWGYKKQQKTDKNFKELGVSLAIINTDKGKKLFNDCKPNLTYFSKTLKDALSTNKSLSEPFPMPYNREAFWNDYRSMSFEKLVKKWLKPEDISLRVFLLSNYKHTVMIKLIIYMLYFPEKAIKKMIRVCDEVKSNIYK